MAKKFHPAVLTANHVLEGDAVWWTGSEWSRHLAHALRAETPEAAADLQALAPSPTFEAEVVGPYLVELNETGAPLVRREAIRADREPTFAYVTEPAQQAA